MVCLGLTCCAPAPPAGVPNGADEEWDLKSDWTWSWKRTLHSGCVTWSAKDSYASVQLVVDSRCEGWRGEGYLPGRGASYFSPSDHLVFRAYWPWTSEKHSDLIVFDSKGMIDYVRPCPHTLSPEQIGGLRLIAQEALAEATTDGERRVWLGLTNALPQRTVRRWRAGKRDARMIGLDGAHTGTTTGLCAKGRPTRARSRQRSASSQTSFSSKRSSTASLMNATTSGRIRRLPSPSSA